MDIYTEQLVSSHYDLFLMWYFMITIAHFFRIYQWHTMMSLSQPEHRTFTEISSLLLTFLTK